MSKKTRLIICSLIVCVMTTAIAFGSVLVSFTTSLEDLENDINRKKSQEEDINDKINSLNNQKKSTQKTAEENKNELERLRKELEKEYSERENALKDLNELKSNLQDMQSKIDDLQKQYDKNVSEFLQRARLMYRYSDYSSLDLILESENILDFSTRANLFKHMIDYDKNLIAEIENLAADMNSKKKYQDEITADKQAAINEINSMIAYLEASEDNTLSKYQGDLSKLDNLATQQKKLEQEEAELDAKIKMLIAESKQYKYEGGKMLWPLESWNRISDTFRFREVHPITGLPSFHEGMDISANYGVKILAAAGGKVIDASYNDGSGNYVVLDHGGGVCTMYAHSSKLLVKAGDTVKKGQPIALVGSTGYATGDHLHFEVRIDGVKVDPVSYLDVPKK